METSATNRQVQLDVKALRHVCYRDLAIVLRQEMMNWQEAGVEASASAIEKDLVLLIEHRDRARAELNLLLAQR